MGMTFACSADEPTTGGAVSSSSGAPSSSGNTSSGVVSSSSGAPSSSGNTSSGAVSSSSGAPSSSGNTSSGAAECAQLDVVLVVDDSASMQGAQEKLAVAAPSLLAALDAIGADGTPLDYRLAVTTTSRTVTLEVTPPLGSPISVQEQGENGAFRARGTTPRRWLERADATRAADLQARVRVGESGAGTEMPLETARLALTDRLADTNLGFRRPGVPLAMLIFTNEDDLSTRAERVRVVGGVHDPVDPLASYVADYDTIAGAGRWSLAILAIPPDTPTCGENSVNATRLAELATSLGARGSLSAFCAEDYTASLQSAVALFRASCIQSQ